jgi:hypothetical protein
MCRIYSEHGIRANFYILNLDCFLRLLEYKNKMETNNNYLFTSEPKYSAVITLSHSQAKVLAWELQSDVVYLG